MTSLKERLVLELADFLAKPYNGLFEGESPDLREFATLMRQLRASTQLDLELLGDLCDPKNALLTPRGPDRDRLSDWRFNPSLVVPLVAALLKVVGVQTSLALIHETGALLRLAATIEADAEQQRYKVKPGDIRSIIRACSVYQEIVAPVQAAVVGIAQGTVDDVVISLEPAAFVSDREGIESCSAAVLSGLLAANELHLDLGEMAYGPIVITFKRKGSYRTTSPYLALIYAVCQSALGAVAARQPLDDIRRQLDIVADLANFLQLSEPLHPGFSPFLFLKRARMVLAVYAGEQPLRALFKNELPLVTDETNPVYGLAAAEQLVARYNEARVMNTVTKRKAHLLLCRTLILALLPADAHIGRSIASLLDDAFTDLHETDYPMEERHRDMLAILDRFFYV